ncbi:MAG: aspartate kinase [Flavobacteriaceae bacterium]|nr:aspartate kinase [Flavobacteriaceae bacterium]
MRIFKFGGASIKNAEGVKNLVIALKHEEAKKTVVVVSAMGKMTNAFEDLLYELLNDKTRLEEKLEFIVDFHLQIMQELFEENHFVFNEIQLLLNELKNLLNHTSSSNYNFVYDQIVCFGELLSTKIIAAYLQEQGLENNWLDIRSIIKTDTNYREAKVDWIGTQENCNAKMNSTSLIITQGFISSDHLGNTTTLGREGSDYTAGILAYCLDAKSVTIWKDVEGVLNADPRAFDNTILLRQISYREAIEMAFYGASVIHPKTLKPLENKRIPLYVRSFLNLESTGTKVSKGINIDPVTPCFVVKKSQILVSISALDFSFMVEENISHIFKLFHEYQLKVNLTQNSAISFSVCLEDNFNKFEEFYKELLPNFKIKYNNNVTLYTIRHFDKKSMNKIEERGTILLKQISRETVQLVIK